MALATGSRRDVPELLTSDRGDGRPGDAHQVRRSELHVAAPATGRHEHRLVPEGRFVEHRGELLALTYRGDATDDIAGASLGSSVLGHGSLLAAQRGRQRLEVELRRDRHD